MKALIRVLSLGTMMLAVAGCGGGGDLGDTPAPPPPTSVGGVVTPHVTAAPQSTTKVVGQAAVFDVTAEGPDLNFSWQDRVPGAGWIASPAAFTSSATSSQLLIPSVTIGHNDMQYRAVVRNTAASVPSAEAVLSVTWGTVSTLEPTGFDFGPGSEGFGSADGGSPGGGDGEGAGAGGGLGKTVQSWITVARVADGGPLGSARTGATSGLVRVKAGPGTAPVLLTLAGSDISTYYDEGKRTMLPLPADQQLHSLVTAFDQHLGVTTLTEAAYRYAINQYILNPADVRSGAVPLKRVASAQEIAQLTPAQIQLAQEAIRAEINRILPARYQLASIATLPTPVDMNSPKGSITSNRYGIAQAVVGGLALAAGNFNGSLAQPALTMNAQLADDLTDGVINGLSLDQRSVFGPPGAAYSPGSLATFLADAADAQMEQFSDGFVIPPAIRVQPVSATVTQGGTATLSVTASGTALDYQWQRDGVNITGANQATHATGTGGSYRVIVSNSAGSVTSANAVVTVVPAVVPPTITRQPVSATVTAGNSATFSVAATGTNLSYQWRNATGPIAGATGPSFTTSTAGSYAVVISNSAGSVTSATVTLTVTPNVTIPVITLQPASTTINAGSTATLVVAATGGELTYQWFNNATPISGATTESYTTGTAGTYSVEVRNSAGAVRSANVTVTVITAPTITAQPASATITEGASHTFSVTASGSSLNYQWRNASGPIPGASAATYATGTAGTYTVVVSNSAGSVTSAAATLTVTPAVVAPAITTQPASVTINAGGTATLTVVATGTTPAYQWHNAAGPIDGATGATYITGVAGSYYVIVSNSAGSVTSSTATVTVTAAPTITTPPASASIVEGQTHTFSVVATGSNLGYQWNRVVGATGTAIPGATSAAYTTDVAGTYNVTVTNTAGSVTSSNATLTVSPVVTLPVITTQPASVVVVQGQPATFTVVATGAGLSYQWQRVAATTTPIAGETAASFTTTQAGTYNVVVRNTAGPVTSANATLSFLAAPTITTQPASAVVAFDDTHLFVVTASGTGLAYQWYALELDGWQPIAGATDDSYATGVTGVYRVVVDNGAGSVTSGIARLTSTGSGAPSISVQPTWACCATSISVTATGSTLAFQWFVRSTTPAGAIVDTPIAGATDNVLSGLKEESYFVVVANDAGVVMSNVVAVAP